MTNLVKTHLESIFGEKMPKTATQFFTADGLANFSGGKIKGLRQIKMNEAQLKAVTRRGYLGAYGWSLE